MRFRIEPVTRIEGHMAITLNVEGNTVKSLQVNIVEPPRLFEKFMENKPAEEAIRIAERICGICYVAHGLASVKAVENAWNIEPPEVAVKLRKLLHAGGYIHSHTLHLALLALPDMLCPGEGAVGIALKHPQLFRKAILIRKYGQEITETVGGRPIHPSTIVPGGMSKPLSAEDKEKLLRKGRKVLKEAIELVDTIFDIYDKLELLAVYPEDPTYYMGLVRQGLHETYDGELHVMNPKGEVIAVFKGLDYLKYIAENSVRYSFVKHPYLRINGEKYRVGTLARVNLAEKFGTPIADDFLLKLRSIVGRPSHNVGAYNLARAVEIIASIEKALSILEDEKIVSEKIRVKAKPKAGVGVGVVEAPRGVLIHHYETDDKGILRKVNLIVATQQNIPSLERELIQVANNLLSKGEKINAVEQKLETIVRAYDPCISCATHLVKLKILNS